jgi:hypothetical protein
MSRKITLFFGTTFLRISRFFQRAIQQNQWVTNMSPHTTVKEKLEPMFPSSQKDPRKQLPACQKHPLRASLEVTFPKCNLPEMLLKALLWFNRTKLVREINVRPCLFSFLQGTYASPAEQRFRKENKDKGGDEARGFTVVTVFSQLKLN